MVSKLQDNIVLLIVDRRSVECSRSQQPTATKKGFPSDVIRLGNAEDVYGTGRLFGGAHPLEWYVLFHSADKIALDAYLDIGVTDLNGLAIPDVCRQSRRNEPKSDTVYVDVDAAPLSSKRLRQTHDTSFC